MILNCGSCGQSFDYTLTTARPGDIVGCPHCAMPIMLTPPGQTVGYSKPVAGMDSRPETLRDEEVLPAGTVIGSYRIERFIGRGGMGSVYLAQHLNLNRQVALKILPQKYVADPEFVGRFKREANALAALNHPNIVSVHDMGTQGQIHFLAMEYVEGANLRDVIMTGKLTPDQALKIVPQLCEALEYAHSRGVIHRDIKPENILMDKSGVPKIADFGLAKIVKGDLISAPLTQTNVIMGTVEYMAPEQRDSTKGVDHRADIYSMGVVLYEMLTGELPIGRFAPASRKFQVDVRIDDVVLKALDADPQLRYQRASQMGTEVQNIATKPAPPPPAVPANPFKMVASIGGAVFLLVLLFAIFGTARKGSLGDATPVLGLVGIVVLVVVAIGSKVAMEASKAPSAQPNVLQKIGASLTPQLKQKIGSYVITCIALWLFFGLVSHSVTVPIIVSVFWGMSIASKVWDGYVFHQHGLVVPPGPVPPAVPTNRVQVAPPSPGKVTGGGAMPVTDIAAAPGRHPSTWSIWCGMGLIFPILSAAGLVIVGQVLYGGLVHFSGTDGASTILYGMEVQGGLRIALIALSFASLFSGALMFALGAATLAHLREFSATLRGKPPAILAVLFGLIAIGASWFGGISRLEDLRGTGQVMQAIGTKGAELPEWDPQVSESERLKSMAEWKRGVDMSHGTQPQFHWGYETDRSHAVICFRTDHDSVVCMSLVRVARGPWRLAKVLVVGKEI